MEQRPRTAESDQGSAPAAFARMSGMNIVADIVRHALPLASLYVFHGNFAGYVVLTAFDLAMGLILIFNTTRGSNESGRTVDPRSRWLISRFFAWVLGSAMFAIEAGIVAIPVAAPAYFFGLSHGVDWHAMFRHPGFYLPVIAMSLLAAGRFQRSFEAQTTVGERGAPMRDAPVIGNPAEDRKRSLAANAAQVTLLATFALLCYVLIGLGERGLYVLPIAFALLLAFYDMRPDLAQRIFPALWRKT